MRIVVVDPDSCVACRNCEHACAFRHSADFRREDARIRVNFYAAERACVPLTCLHCEEAWCLEVCPAAAISRDPSTGAVVIAAERCAGCKMCILACPYGAIHFDAEAGVSTKCDLCGGDPACVRHCISGALDFMEVDQAADRRRAVLDVRLRRDLHLDKEGE